MGALTAYNQQTQIAYQQELSAGLFMDFVKWVDRSAGTTRTYIINLRQFAAWLKYTVCTHPEREDIISYRDWLSTEHEAIQIDPESVTGWKYRTDKSGKPVKIICKPATVAQYLRSVCQFFKWTAASGLYPNIAQNIHAPKVNTEDYKKDALTPAEVLNIESSIAQKAQEAISTAASYDKDTAGRIQRSTEQGKRLFAMYQLAVNAGLRTIEISRANIKDLETKGGQSWLYIWGKGRSEADQKKPIAPEVAESIKDYLKSRTDHYTGSSPLFVSTGNRSGGNRIAPTTISTMLKKAMQEAGFDSEKLTAHSLRHSAGTAAMEATGDNIYLAQEYLRHSDPKTTERYTHRKKDAAQAAIAKQIYDLYHGINDNDPRQQLEQAIDKLSRQQLEQLKGIAAAMAT